MKPGTKNYKAWIRNLEVGDTIMLAGSDCPESEMGNLRTIANLSARGGIFVECTKPKRWDEGALTINEWVFHINTSNDGYFAGKDSQGNQIDYYITKPEATQ